MTRDEATAILAILKTAYPAFYKDMSDEEIDDVINLWAAMFQDDNVKVVTEAVRAYIATDTKGFPPVIGQIKEKIAMIMQSQTQTMTEMEAWQRVKAAISYYNASENFKELPPILQKVVGSPNILREWALMDGEVVNSVIQSNFMRSYKAKVAQQKEYAMIPSSTKQLIAGLAQKHSLTEGKYELYSKCSTDADKM
ncbi:MAG TPA: replicative helicase loader/inhibitor [Sedimentibacter sp.]|nr:replicative helicase loader/inhibitor [Sedimentibacter sp.]